MSLRFVVVVVLGTLTGAACSAAGEPVDYLRDVKPVLKARCYSCHGSLQQKAKLRRSGSRRASDIRVNEDQARRVAWRIVRDWVEAQMAIVELEMAKVDQVFLPYARTPNGQTLYEHVRASNLLSAPHP